MGAQYLVVGLGKTGQSVIRYCLRHNIDCVAFDTRASLPNLPALKDTFPSVKIYLSVFPPACWAGIEKVIVSPGVSLQESVLQEAKARALPVLGDIELFAKETIKPVIAITGTNGKSTVTTMVGDILKHANLKVAVCGNIGEPVLDTLTEAFDVWVVELSSFQLDTVYSLKPRVACFLNAAPDHLDRHENFDAYVCVKKRVYNTSAHQVFNAEDKQTYPEDPSMSVGFALNDTVEYGLCDHLDKTYLTRQRKPFMPVSALKVKGQHNYANALAAIAITDVFGIEAAAIEKALKAFKGLPHRCEWVKEDRHVTWINDSKGTNVGATLAALSGLGRSMKGKIIWLAGGQGKDADFSPLAPNVAQFVRLAVLMGEDKEKIAKGLKKETEIRYVNNMEDAVLVAKGHAKAGDCVLLSPACASFDMFDSFVHRGEVFMKTVLAE